jgi:methylthioribose-1-phosphate isomerase
MKISAEHYRTIWVDENKPGCIRIIDQRCLPHQLSIMTLSTLDDAVSAIADMAVRGAPLIGATGAYGFYLGMLERGVTAIDKVAERLRAARPTAVNLAWAVDRMLQAIRRDPAAAVELALAEANAIVEEDIEISRMIGLHGLELIAAVASRNPGRPVNILTHCNAGWLACIDWGTATAPIYQAHRKGIPVHVWVDETRPRNQGAFLTAFELGEEGVAHTVIVDNAGGHLMQTGQVDLVLVGTDRTTADGDVCNKIGTYLKALAARDNGIPFYVALPSTTIDWQARSGLDDIPIEERDSSEVHEISGLHDGTVKSVRLTPAGSAAANPAFDITPARLVTGLITERGICKPSREALLAAFPEQGGGDS